MAHSNVARYAFVRLPLWRGAAALFAVATVFACHHDAPSPGGDAPSQSSSAAAAARPEAAASASAAPSATAAAPEGPATALAGTWEGSYDAKKGSVVMPKGVKDVAHSKDDGKAAVGKGTITINIGPTGTVSGNGKGALGDVELSGKLDEQTIRATIMPVDPTAESAMTGVLVAMVKDGALRGEIRVAGPDATVVRESTIELKKK